MPRAESASAAATAAARFFDQRCLQAHLTFDEQNARALADGYALVKEIGRTPDFVSANFRMKTWQVSRPGGPPYELMIAEETIGEYSQKDGCYLSAPEILGADMEAALVQLSRVDPSTRRSTRSLDAGGRNRLVHWRVQVGGVSPPWMPELMLSSRRSGEPGSTAFLTIRIQKRRP